MKLEREVEEKAVTAASGDVIPIAGAGQMHGLGPYLVQGDTGSTRTGDRIMVRRVSARVSIELTAIEALGTSVRIILVYDRRPEGALPANITNCLATDSLLAPYQNQEAFRGRFRFLFDRTVSFDTNQTKWCDSWFIRKEMPINYGGNAGTVADIYKGHFFLISLARGNAAAVNVIYDLRWIYVDM